ncbi:MAG: aldo/keto reductase, partial [Tetragenococcus koreensis]|nr:aldo/keto reductase [Tetragenococcus koreensis]
RGVVVIPKSHNQERQKQNLAVFDFELTEEDKQLISQQ